MIDALIRVVVHNGSVETNDYQDPQKVRKLLDVWLASNLDSLMEVIDEDQGVADTLLFTAGYTISVEEEKP